MYCTSLKCPSAAKAVAVFLALLYCCCRHISDIATLLAGLADKRLWVKKKEKKRKRLAVSHHTVCLSVYLFICLSVCLSVCLSICLSVRPSVRLFVCLSVHLSVCLTVRLSVCLSVYLSVYLCVSVCLPVCLSICLSVYLPSVLSSGWLSGCVSVHLSVSLAGWLGSVSETLKGGVSEIIKWVQHRGFFFRLPFASECPHAIHWNTLQHTATHCNTSMVNLVEERLHPIREERERDCDCNSREGQSHAKTHSHTHICFCSKCCSW